MTEKALLRRQALLRRSSLLPAQRWQKSRQIIRHFLSWPGLSGVKRVMLYASFGGEVETWPLLHWALATNRELYLPRTLKRRRTLAIHRVQRYEDLFPGAYGILEPLPSAPRLAPQELDLVVCPGVAFDPSGGRVGYGGGFYDRLLEAAPGVFRVALAFSCQVFPSLPLEPHDIRMDMVITEEGPLGPRQTP